MTFQFIGLGVLLLLSGFFSSSELAFIVTNKLKIELRARKNKRAAKYAQYFIKNPQDFFSTILIANNIVNIAFASLLTIILLSLYSFSDFVILLITSVLLLLFGELLPKYLAREFADSMVLISAIPLKILSVILAPFVKITSSISTTITNTKNITEEIVEIHKDEFHDLIDESSEAGNVDSDHSDIFKNIIDLGDQKVYEAMTPRTDIIGVSLDASIAEVIKLFMESGYSKLPVFDENLDNIKGVISVYDLFNNPEDIISIIREVSFVPETKKSLEMLNEFLDKRVSISIVVDEFGGTAGIITIEDIMEEMFGEIQDEYDDDPDICKKVNDNTYIINGKVEIDFINEEHSLNIHDGEYETLAGYITTSLGRIPEKGETVHCDNFEITILHATKIKIGLVKILINTNSE
ncbi:MAG: HlyC/CorC family transporter [Ignavibacteriae bacterium]|nr:HlyC/CorC family transporter [Ignavibacteriota bacterium]